MLDITDIYINLTKRKGERMKFKLKKVGNASVCARGIRGLIWNVLSKLKKKYDIRVGAKYGVYEVGDEGIIMFVPKKLDVDFTNYTETDREVI